MRGVRRVSLHASARVAAQDRERLEKLCRCAVRAAVAESLLVEFGGGGIRSALKKPWRDGTKVTNMKSSEKRAGARLLCLLLSFFCMIHTSACASLFGGDAQLRELREAKLASPVFRLANWHSDFDQARECAANEGKVLFAYFTRSYAECGGCNVVESGLLASPGFQRFADQVVLFVHSTSKVPLTNPLPDEPYPRLAFQKGVTHVPSFRFMDPEGNIVGKPDVSLAAFEETLAMVRRLVDLRKNPGVTPDHEREMFFQELRLDLVAADQIAVRAGAWSLTDEESAIVAAKIVDAEYTSAFRDFKVGTVDERQMNARIYTMASAGRLPSNTVANGFWIAVLRHAGFIREEAMAERAYGILQRRCEGVENSWVRSQRPVWRQYLEDARRP